MLFFNVFLVFMVLIIVCTKTGANNCTCKGLIEIWNIKVTVRFKKKSWCSCRSSVLLDLFSECLMKIISVFRKI